MGLGSRMAGAAVDAAARQAQMKSELKGRTPDQQKVIKYFYGASGCLSKGMTDAEYDSMVRARVSSVNWKERALAKLGVDETEVNEIEPVHFEGYKFLNQDRNYALKGKDGIWRSSMYEITWLFFGEDAVYIYQSRFNMDEEGKRENTAEYYYKDITNFKTSNEDVEKIVVDKTSCTGKTSYARKTIEYNEIAVIVPGDDFECSVSNSSDFEASVQGMKAKLREKKRS